MLIALASPAPGSGKSEVARILVEQHGFTRMKFAAPLKDMVRVLLAATGMDRDMIERCVDGDLKETHIREIGASSRRLQITLGTEWGREMIHPDLWVNIVRGGITSHRSKHRDARIVLDDMRFPNELQMVRELGGIPAAVLRPGFEVGKIAHVSEGGLRYERMLSILTDGSLDDLARKVDDALSYSFRFNY